MTRRTKMYRGKKSRKSSKVKRKSSKLRKRQTKKRGGRMIQRGGVRVGEEQGGKFYIDNRGHGSTAAGGAAQDWLDLYEASAELAGRDVAATYRKNIRDQINIYLADKLTGDGRKRTGGAAAMGAAFARPHPPVGTVYEEAKSGAAASTPYFLRVDPKDAAAPQGGNKLVLYKKGNTLARGMAAMGGAAAEEKIGDIGQCVEVRKMETNLI